MGLEDMVRAIYDKVVVDKVYDTPKEFKLRSIDKIGRVTIPKTYREILGIGENDELTVFLQDGKIIIAK